MCAQSELVGIMYSLELIDNHKIVQRLDHFIMKIVHTHSTGSLEGNAFLAAVIVRHTTHKLWLGYHNRQYSCFGSR